MKNPLQFILLLGMLVLLPLGSWLYMKKGYNYQKEAMSELRNYGQLSPFLAQDFFQRKIGSDELDGKLVLLNYYNSTKAADSRMEMIEKLHEQFDDRTGVYFVNVGMSPGNKIEEQYALLDTNQVFFIPATDRPCFFLGQDILMPTNAGVSYQDSLTFQPIEASTLPDFNYYVLLDTKGNIRNYYKADEPERMKRLVEHIALTMPRKAKGKTESVPKKI